MSAAPHFIQFVHKASNVCVYCRVRKQKCDRMLPRCERCAAKDQECDYTPPFQPGALQSEPLISYQACGHADLTPHGTTEILHVVKACIDAPLNPGLATALLRIVAEILDSTGFNLVHAFTDFGPCIQQWCPILVEDQILGNCDYTVNELVNARDGPDDPILWFCMWLVLRKPCSPLEDMGQSELYITLKQVHALLQTDPRPELRSLQTGMIIAIYELGHGLRQQSFQTLAACTATLRLLELEARRKQDAESLKRCAWLNASIFMLDRQLPLSMTTDHLPLTIPTGHPISITLRKSLAPGLPSRPINSSATSPWKVFARTGAAISAGPALEYIHSRQRGEEPEISYDEADCIANRCISMLVIKPDSPVMFQCDVVPMIVCSHIILQATHTQHIRDSFSDSRSSEAPEYVKALVALRFSRSMAWETVRTAIQLVESEESVSRTTFAGLCSVLRAGLAVLETAVFVDDKVIHPGEAEAYVRMLTWFSGRWTIGKEYLERVEKVLSIS
ncbi:hypothetical protein CC86DRAFT_448667 [Ophiobolus disseminans]|uniref:Zn(2)-C6 fungal-type domain-containing protein n=1 Tax=Ophiobolus disseminans TaxID=1469910 RepID=A0A6A6ZN21_9PLEO|nr:hypothetical protein CC86DRAFT_448667 [Ophiobolus disseminans]